VGEAENTIITECTQESGNIQSKYSLDCNLHCTLCVKAQMITNNAKLLSFLHNAKVSPESGGISPDYKTYIGNKPFF